MTYYQPIQKLVTVGNNHYLFMPNHNISLGWVKSEDVEKMLSIRGGCCGGNNPNIFRLANEMQIRLYNGAER